jgi:hypothetical protein
MQHGLQSPYRNADLRRGKSHLERNSQIQNVAGTKVNIRQVKA